MGKSVVDIKQNSFDSIRYFSAISVMLLHYTYYAIVISGQGTDVLRLLRRFTEFFPGVVILFSLSGFLISLSYENCKTKREFFLKRIFRLYPELWVCTIVNLIVILLLAKELVGKEIFLWLLTQVFGIANTPSCVRSFATGSINGALWTIFIEMQLYIFLGVTYERLRKIKRSGWIIAFSGCILMNLSCDYITGNSNGFVAKIIERVCFPYLLWFLIGVFCYLKRERMLLFLKKYLWILFLIFGLNQYFNICKNGYYEDIVTGIFLPLITIAMAYTLPGKRWKYDISYGLFLYHWIVINIMVELDVFNRISWYMCLMFFLVFSFLVAWISGCFVKKHIFMIKNWLFN